MLLIAVEESISKCFVSSIEEVEGVEMSQRIKGVVVLIEDISDLIKTSLANWIGSFSESDQLNQGLRDVANDSLLSFHFFDLDHHCSVSICC